MRTWRRSAAFRRHFNVASAAPLAFLGDGWPGNCRCRSGVSPISFSLVLPHESAVWGSVQVSKHMVEYPVKALICRTLAERLSAGGQLT
jgi:hypothetical protein